MNEFIGVVKLFGGLYEPKNWMYCDGRLLPISQYNSLFSIIGTTYGGNGTTTFALPNLNQNQLVPAHPNKGGFPGRVNLVEGQIVGEKEHTLTINELPHHNHSITTSAADAISPFPEANMFLAKQGDDSSGSFVANNVYNNGALDTALSQVTVWENGGGQAHNNMGPTLSMSYIICVFGVYPPHQ
ncbi:MAG: phage tail protein [Bacteroidetes bacterium]|nr:MAG: phage tail protein [Bacteroidota bacterium]